MFQLFKKRKLHTKLGLEIVNKYSHRNFLVIICRFLAPTKVFLQLEHYIELLLHLEN